MAASMWQVRDELWEVVAPLSRCTSPILAAGGRASMTGCASARSCSCCSPGSPGGTFRASWAARRRPRIAGFRSGSAAGVFGALHRELLRRLNAAGRIDWSTAVVDGSHVRALQGGLDRALAG